MDTLTKSERSRLMASIRSKDTRPERIVRSLVHRMGFRFRLHSRHLPGKPDIVLARHRAVILVHGCFWHRHSRCRLASQPKTRVRFWNAKLASNAERDRRVKRELRSQGWRVLVIWECETRRPERLEARIAGFLGE